MTRDEIQAILAIHTGPFKAFVSAHTSPAKGFYKNSLREKVILYNGVTDSVFEDEVRQRLIEEGKDPSNFSVLDLPWGERVDGSSLIVHGDSAYLQTLVIEDGEEECYFGRTMVSPSDFPDVFRRGDERRHAAARQGLPEDKAVLVRTYSVRNILSVIPE